MLRTDPAYRKMDMDAADTLREILKVEINIGHKAGCLEVAENMIRERRLETKEIAKYTTPSIEEIRELERKIRAGVERMPLTGEGKFPNM